MSGKGDLDLHLQIFIPVFSCIRSGKNADLHFGHVYWDLPIPHEPIRLTKNISQNS